LYRPTQAVAGLPWQRNAPTFGAEVGLSQARTIVDLALQGGGAYGAFTWGVLDRLLEDGRIEVGGLSGASAGAINAVVLADGLLADGPDGARQALWAFWKRVGRAARRAGWHQNVFEHFLGPWPLRQSPWRAVADYWARTVSPYHLNPLNLNPLLDILREQVDFERLRAAARPHLFVAATAVGTGRLRIFRNAELSAEAVMASACLPLLFQAVEIGGEAYWDVGYAGNPALLPLIAETEPRDLVLVQINPTLRHQRPRTAEQILDRVNEITFNNSLLKEMRAIAVMKQLLEGEERPPHGFRQPLFEQMSELLVHRIEAEEPLGELGAQNRLAPQWEMLMRLHGLGRRTADAWLVAHFEALGRRSTVDLVADYM